MSGTAATWGGVERYTRAHDLSEIIAAYEYAMQMWEDRSRRMVLGEPTDVKPVHEILARMSPQREFVFESLKGSQEFWSHA